MGCSCGTRRVTIPQHAGLRQFNPTSNKELCEYTPIRLEVDRSILAPHSSPFKTAPKNNNVTINDHPGSESRILAQKSLPNAQKSAETMETVQKRDFEQIFDENGKNSAESEQKEARKGQENGGVAEEKAGDFAVGGVGVERAEIVPKNEENGEK